MSQFTAFKELADRRDLWGLLHRLGKGVPSEEANARRIHFLAWCCQHCHIPNGPAPQVTEDTLGDVKGIYFDIVTLAAQCGLDLERAAVRLEKLIRQIESQTHRIYV